MTRYLWRGLFLLGVAASAILGLMLGFWLRGRQTPKPVPVVTISFLELPDGDCSVIKTPDDHFIVIDAGGPASDDAVAQTLRRMGAAQIDLLVIASPAESAVGGAPNLIDSGIPIRSVWLDSVADAGDAQQKAIDELQAKHIPTRVVHENEQVQIGSSPMQFTAVWPPRHGSRAFTDNLVCRVDYGSQSCLFLGPLDAASEPYLISGASDKLHADVLQVTEHGDGEGSALELLRRAQPEIAVISSSPQTPPAPAAVDRLQAAGADIWRTDVQGMVTVTLSMQPGTPVVTGSRV